MKKLLTAEEAADLLSIEVATLYRMRYKGSGPPAIRVGKYLRFDPDELDRWLSAQAAASA